MRNHNSPAHPHHTHTILLPYRHSDKGGVTTFSGKEGEKKKKQSKIISPRRPKKKHIYINNKNRDMCKGKKEKKGY